MRRLVVVLAALAVIALAPESVLAQASKSRVTSAATSKTKATTGKTTKTTATRSRAPVAAPVRPSEGQMAGLRRTDDPLDLKSSVALVVNQDTNEVLFPKNPHAVLPIASITKLMTALITVDAGLALDETLEVERSVRTIDRMRSWLNPGVRLTRGQALHLALMSSENHAAHLLGRTYPGGIEAAVQAMNAKAQLLIVANIQTKALDLEQGMGLSGEKKAQDGPSQKKEKKAEPSEGGMMQKLKPSGQITADKGMYQDYTLKDLRLQYRLAKGVLKNDPLGLQFSGEGSFTGEGSLNGNLQCVMDGASTIQKTLKGMAVAKLGKGAIKESQIFDAIALLTGIPFFKECKV